MAQRLTRHNGRANKKGVYKARHNDRKFDLENAEHIDSKKTDLNVYWDCINRVPLLQNQRADSLSFSEVESRFYHERYAGYVAGQHERNAKARHTDRDRSVEDILADKRFCPEETIYQIGNVDDHIDSETLLEISTEFLKELEWRFGDHIHVLDWALHIDEGTPHIHERHVFDYTNKYGEIQPGQEKALEALGFELPDQTKKQGKYNNRKITFDAACRTILFDICKRNGLHLEEEVSYGGREYLEKQDYILMKQKEKLAEQEKALEIVDANLKETEERLSDTEQLLDEMADLAYEKAVEVVTDTVRAETQKQDLIVVDEFQKSAVEWNKEKPKVVQMINDITAGLKNKLKVAAQGITARITRTLHNTQVKEEGKEEIKKSTRKSMKELLARKKMDADKYNANRNATDIIRNNKQEL